MSLIGIDAGSLAGAPAGEGVQTLHDLSSRNQMVTQHLKQALDTLDEKNKRIQELDNKCAEYENLLTKHGEKAFNSFDKRLEEFKTHHVWTVKQLLLQHEALVKRVESRLEIIPKQKARIYEQKEIIEDLRAQIRTFRGQYHVQQIHTVSAKMNRTANQYDKNKERLAKVENSLRLAKQTVDDQKLVIEKLQAQNRLLKSQVDAFSEKATRREANKYSDLFKKASQMVNLEQFKKEELSKAVDKNPYVQNVYKQQLQSAKKQIASLQSRLTRRSIGGSSGTKQSRPASAGSLPAAPSRRKLNVRQGRLKAGQNGAAISSSHVTNGTNQEVDGSPVSPHGIKPVAADAALAYIGVDPNSQFLDMYEPQTEPVQTSKKRGARTNRLDQILFPVEEADALMQRIKSRVSLPRGAIRADDDN